MAVPSNPKLTDVYAEFGAPAGTPLTAFVRGGSWVPNTAANANVPTALPINLQQLAGAVNYVPVSATASPGTISSASSLKGTFTIGTVTVTGQGGNGSYSYSDAVLTAGSSSGPNTNISHTQSGNQYTFQATNINANADSVNGTYKVTVSDGQTSADVTFDVNWN